MKVSDLEYRHMRVVQLPSSYVKSGADAAIAIEMENTHTDKRDYEYESALQVMRKKQLTLGDYVFLFNKFPHIRIINVPYEYILVLFYLPV